MIPDDVSWIADRAGTLGVPISDDVATSLSLLMREVLRFNERINLIAPCSPKEAVERHLLDSLAMLRLVDRHDVNQGLTHWFDVGTGGGLPGLVWAIARPSLSLTLVEPVGKKRALVKRLAQQWSPGNTTVVQSRLENLPTPDGPVGAVSRAVFAPDEWVRRAEKWAVSGSVILATMGRKVHADVLGRAVAIDRFTLPESGAQRVNALILL